MPGGGGGVRVNLRSAEPRPGLYAGVGVPALIWVGASGLNGLFPWRWDRPVLLLPAEGDATLRSGGGGTALYDGPLLLFGDASRPRHLPADCRPLPLPGGMPASLTRLTCVPLRTVSVDLDGASWHPAGHDPLPRVTCANR